MNLYFVTGNKHKFVEVSKLIPGIRQLELDLVEIQELDPRKIVEHKLREARKKSKDMIAVEDVSFSMAALGGLPGPQIKWFIQTLGAKGLLDLSKRLGKDGAKASATVGLITKQGKVHYFGGEVTGKIVSPRGDTSFGFDPIFQPDGMSKTFGELETGVKNIISHRAKAWSKVREYLKYERIVID